MSEPLRYEPSEVVVPAEAIAARMPALAQEIVEIGRAHV